MLKIQTTKKEDSKFLLIELIHKKEFYNWIMSHKNRMIVTNSKIWNP